MNARYAAVDVSKPDGRHLRARFRIENVSPDTWRRDQGFAIGYHIFDPDTDTLVVDGARTELPQDLGPGQPAMLALDMELPAEPGRYRVFISPMQEDVAWFYQRGWPFLLLDVIVDGGRAVVARVRVVTSRTLARERILRAAKRAFTLPAAALWTNRSLIRTMVRRDILGRYRGSFGGAFWTVLSPLILMLTYFFVFGIVLESRIGGDTSRTSFAFYFFAGMLPWLAFSEAVGRAPTVLLEHRNFVKKLLFPVETLPVNLAISGLVTQGVMLVLFLAAFAAARGYLPASAVWLPVLLIPQVLFTLGLCWFLSALGAFVRDLGQLIGFLLTLWFFLTPICYLETSLPRGALAILGKNPIFLLVRSYRAILIDGHAPDWTSLAKLAAVSAFVFFAGYAWFYKLRKSFADVV
jgi:lipopolysaccharide transport system permease protein